MKIDRLLSIIVYLMNRDLVSARVLAERFEVTVRTIQRDMEAIELAGIPVVSIQGPHGGYGIMESFKMDRRLVSAEDLYYIISSLRSVSDSMGDDRLEGTLEKMKGLLPAGQSDILSRRNSKLSMDFTMLGGDHRQREAFRTVKDAVDSERLLRFRYTSNKLETTRRTVEPLTIAFKWRSWYLFAWCREKEDYRTFRISRIKDPEILPARFKRKDISFEEYSLRQEQNIPSIELLLRFDACMRSLVEEFYPEKDCSEGPGGSLIVKAAMPEDNWMYGFLLSYGPHLTILDPPHVRERLREFALQIAARY